VPELKSVLAWSAVAAGAAIVAGQRLSKALGDPEAPFLDWELVRRTAYSRCGGEGRAEVEQAGRDYDPLVAELVPVLAEACNTDPQRADFGRVRVVSRHGFIDQNLAMMQRMLRPIEERQAGWGAVRPNPLMRVPSSLYMGSLLGFMARRVLGQYDPVLSFPPEAGRADDQAAPLPSPALLIVEANVRGFAETCDLPLDSLRRWLMLHELTHAWQFESHAWLAPHIGALMNEMLVTGVVEQLGGGRRMATLEALRQLPATLGDQLRGIGRLRAIMSVLEGYGNFVMHRVGSEHIEGFDRLESAFHQRQSERSLLERLVLALTGMAVKLRQYELGERFAVAVTEAGGYPLLNRVWEGPEMMPSLAEMRVPQRWIERARGL